MNVYLCVVTGLCIVATLTLATAEDVANVARGGGEEPLSSTGLEGPGEPIDVDKRFSKSSFMGSRGKLLIIINTKTTGSILI